MTPLQIAEPGPPILPRATLSADEYRTMANVCLNWGRAPLTKDAHRVCVTLARAWLRAALWHEAAVSDYSGKSPLIFETPNELPYGRKVLIEDRRATEDRIKSVDYSFGRPDVRNKLYELDSASDPERAHSLPKLPLRDSLRATILALTVGATSGAGAVLALVGLPAQQRITSVASQAPVATMEHSVTAADLAYDRRNVDGETPEWVAPRGPFVVAASAALAAPLPNKPASSGTDRTSALDVTSSLERTTSKEPEKAPHHVERKHHGRVTVRHRGWRHRYLFAFLRIW